MISEAELGALALMYDVPLERMLRTGEVEVVRTLLAELHAKPEKELNCFEEYGGAVVSWIARIENPPLLTRIAVVCAPLIGRKQMETLWQALEYEGRIDAALFISQEPPDPSTKRAICTLAIPPAIYLTTLDALLNQRDSRHKLAEEGAKLARKLPSRRLYPTVRHPWGSTELHTAHEVLLAWARGAIEPCHVLLVGDAGFGKTVAARALVASLCRDFLNGKGESPCAVYLSVGDMLEGADIYQWVLRELQDRLELTTLANAESFLKRSGILLVLDGLESLGGTDLSRLRTLERSLERLLRSPCRVLMIAREPPLFAPSGAPEDRLPVRQLRLDPLEPADVQGFLSALDPPVRRELWSLVQLHQMEELTRRPDILEILFDGATLFPKRFEDGRPVLFALLSSTYRRWTEADARSFLVPTRTMESIYGHLAAILELSGRSVGRLDELPPDLAKIFSPTLDLGQGTSTRGRLLTLQGRTWRFVHRVQVDYWFCWWVVQQILAENATALRHLWLGRHDLTLLSGMLLAEDVQAKLERWALATETEPDLRELASYLLAFTRDRGRALAVARRILESEPSEVLKENAMFTAVTLGDRAELSRLVNEARAPLASPARTLSRTQLLVLASHEQFLDPKIREEILDTLGALDAAEVSREQEELALDERAPGTRRAAAITALGLIGDVDRHLPLLRRLIDYCVARGELGRHLDQLRLAMAAQRAWQELARRRSDATPG